MARESCEEEKKRAKLRLRSHYEAKDSSRKTKHRGEDSRLAREKGGQNAKHDKWLFFIRKLYLFFWQKSPWRTLARACQERRRVSFINYSVRMRILQSLYTKKKRPLRSFIHSVRVPGRKRFRRNEWEKYFSFCWIMSKRWDDSPGRAGLNLTGREASFSIAKQII